MKKQTQPHDVLPQSPRPAPGQTPCLSAATTGEKIVLSASRRTDLVSCYPQYLIERLEQYPPENVHTLVLWTKNPTPLLHETRLRQTLLRYAQLFIHLTITGLGGSVLEPKIPPWESIVGMIPDLIELTGDARRISWRFDPLIRVKTPDGILTNSTLFHLLAEKISDLGITTCRISWVAEYKKVIRRIAGKGYTLLSWSEQEKMEQAARFEKEAAACGIALHYCAMQEFPRSRCIDSELLSSLHPRGEQCSVRKSKGQRTLCGCTESIDIGWYSLKCTNGCLYCYAEPLVV